MAGAGGLRRGGIPAGAQGRSWGERELRWGSLGKTFPGREGAEGQVRGGGVKARGSHECPTGGCGAEQRAPQRRWPRLEGRRAGCGARCGWVLQEPSSVR